MRVDGRIIFKYMRDLLINKDEMGGVCSIHGSDEMCLEV